MGWRGLVQPVDRWSPPAELTPRLVSPTRSFGTTAWECPLPLRHFLERGACSCLARLLGQSLVAGPPLTVSSRCRSLACALGPPQVEDFPHFGPHPLPRLGAWDSRHQQLVVRGVDVADRGGNGQGDGFGVQGSAGRGSSDPSATPCTGVGGNCLRPLGWAARKLPADRLGKCRLEPNVG